MAYPDQCVRVSADMQ